MYTRSVIYALLLAVSTVDVTESAELGAVEIVIVTRIDPPDPQAGMKSTQKLIVDFAARTVESSFETGLTDIEITKLGSVRDSFTVSGQSFSGNSATVSVAGETASGVLIIPNINYKFTFSVTANGKGLFNGCHDGYPSYLISVDGRNVYSHKHAPTAIEELFGTCDVSISPAKAF